MAGAQTERGFYRNYFREIDVLHGLQSTPEERDWLLTTPKGDVKQSDIVLYLGCNVMRTTHLVRTVVDVFKLREFQRRRRCVLLLRHPAPPARRRSVGPLYRSVHRRQFPQVPA